MYVLISLPHLQKKVTTKAQVPTNRHTNPPSTRVSLPIDTAEHAPNFLSPSMAESSEATPLIQLNPYCKKKMLLFVHAHTLQDSLYESTITNQ